jgi:signal peptidase II
LFGSNGVLLIAMAIVVLVLFWYSFRDAAAKSLTVRIAFGMIAGGAIANIIDRVHYGYVIDFIDFYRIWPNIFNVADSCITVGVGLLIISSFATRRHSR